MYLVKDLYEQHGKKLHLELWSSEEGIDRPIKVPEAERPGLSLAGYLKNHSGKRILVFGKVEIEYLRDLEQNVCLSHLEAIFKEDVPAIIITRNYRPPKELLQVAKSQGIPLFRTNLSTMNLLSRLTLILTEEFAPSINCHGTLVDVFGVGVFIQGDSAMGKSEAALGLIERGHRLISDDLVKIKVKEGSYLVGSGNPMARHHMEIQGVGIINAANLHGTVCVGVQKTIDIVLQLEQWKEQEHFYDYSALENKFTILLGIKLPFHTLHIKPGRDAVLLIETLALNHRLKEMGYNTQFETKALEINKLKGIKKVSSPLSALKSIIVLFGPPGAGKGTFSEFMQEQYGYSSFNIGDIVREEINLQTEIGKEADEYLRKENFLEEFMIQTLVLKRLIPFLKNKTHVIINAFPRTKDSFYFINTLLQQYNISKQILLVKLYADDATCEKRILSRSICGKCAHIYNTHSCPPKQANICDLCSGPLKVRTNDNAVIARKRLKEFHQITEKAYHLAQTFFPSIEFDTSGSLEECLQQYTQFMTHGNS